MPGLDDELGFLLRRYPRSDWHSHANLGAIARFWLERHAMFRELDRVIQGGVQDTLERRTDPSSFRPWLHRYLGFFVGQLDEHHGVEDQHYFPLFRRAEPRLARGFDVLERDHDLLHRALEELGSRAGPVLRRDADEPSCLRALGRLAEAQAALGEALLRHLDDEEDLVVPLILEQGERTLFGPF